MNVTDVLNIVKLYNSPKVFLWSLLSSISLFTMYWGVRHPYNIGDTTMTILSIAVLLVGAIFFVAFYTIGNKQLAIAYAKIHFNADDVSIKDTFKQAKKNILPIFCLLLCFLLLTQFIVPLIGMIAGSFFRISVSGHDFNILTMFINFFAVYAWLFIATTQITLLKTKFINTINETIGFVFDNFLKMFGYAISIFLLMTVFQFIVVSLVPLSRFIALPIIAMTFGYILALINSITLTFVTNNMDFDDDGVHDDTTTEDTGKTVSPAATTSISYLDNLNNH